MTIWESGSECKEPNEQPTTKWPVKSHCDSRMHIIWTLNQVIRGLFPNMSRPSDKLFLPQNVSDIAYRGTSIYK